MTRALLIGTVSVLAIAFASEASMPQQPTIIQRVAQGTADRDAHRFLAVALQQFQEVPAKSLKGDAKKQVEKLRHDLEQLVATYEKQPVPPVSMAIDGRAAKAADEADWRLKFDAVERDLVAILGAGPKVGADSTPTAATAGAAAPTAQATGSAATRPGETTTPVTGETNPQATGLAGVSQSALGVKDLDPGVRAQLEEVRKSVELFYDATSMILHH